MPPLVQGKYGVRGVIVAADLAMSVVNGQLIGAGHSNRRDLVGLSQWFLARRYQIKWGNSPSNNGVAIGVNDAESGFGPVKRGISVGVGASLVCVN